MILMRRQPHTDRAMSRIGITIGINTLNVTLRTGPLAGRFGAGVYASKR
jgi:hypothetical protein